MIDSSTKWRRIRQRMKGGPENRQDLDFQFEPRHVEFYSVACCG